MKKFCSLIFLLLTLHYLPLNCNSLEDLSVAHLSNFTKPQPISQESEDTSSSWLWPFASKKVTPLSAKEVFVSEYEKYQKTYDFLRNNSSQKDETEITSTRTWNDLQIIKEQHGISLLNLVDRTETTFGKVALASFLTHPTSSLECLRHKQEALRFLLENPTILEELKSYLKMIAQSETEFFYFWREEENQEALKEVLDPLFYTSDKALLKPLQNLNGSQFYQESMSIVNPTWTVSKLIGEPYTSFASAYVLTLCTLLCKQSGEKEIWTPDGFFKCPEGTLDFIKRFFTNRYESYKSLLRGDWIPSHEAISKFKEFLENSPKAKIGLCVGAGSLFIAWHVKKSTNDYNKKLHLQLYLHKKMIAVSKIVRAQKAICNIVNAHPVLKSALLLSDSLNENSHDSQIQGLSRLLNSSTFDGQATSFCRGGKVCAAYYQMKNYKEMFDTIVLAIGEVDALVSTAKLYQEHAQTNTPYNFVNFKESTTPVLKIVEMWNPFISSSKIVKNSINLGEGNPCNIILTGPNAGGKSTFLKGVALSVILAQTYGIAPADGMEFTLFSGIETYMNIVDDIAGEQSLFMAEVTRTKALLEKINSLSQTNDFMFAVLDELFTGTAPEAAEKASYKVGQSLGKKENCISLIATHFHIMTKLEEEGLFSNYKVSVDYNENGTLHYLFKIVPGISNQNVVENIFKEQGLDTFI